MIWVLLQQSTSESKPSEARQLFDPQKWLLWHSIFESQSPSSSPQRTPYVQKLSSPRIGWLQQSTSESKSSEAGQLFDPQASPYRHSSWESQSPSFFEQVLQLQNPNSPLLILAQLTKGRVLQLNFYFKNIFFPSIIR